jgi:hypothetical protein|tara:strand:- start:1817 stop:2206 length:390 start_codon:yes stop_codon:yes gene_type:complete
MGRKSKKKADPGLELARSDTQRIKKLSDLRDIALKKLNAKVATFDQDTKRVVRDSGSLSGLRKIEDALQEAGEAYDEAQQDVEKAPFEMLKLLQAAERKHGKPFRKKKTGRGALLTKEAAKRLLKARRK